MVGGIDRYYQIARCLRDEDLRADRQFEFMQLDAEMSFATQDDVLAAISDTVAAAVEAVTGRAARRDPADDVARGARSASAPTSPTSGSAWSWSSSPTCSPTTGFNAFKAPCVKGIRVPGGGDTTRSRLDDLTDAAKRWGAKGLVWMRVEAAEAAAPSSSTRRSPSSCPTTSWPRSLDAREPRPATSCCSSPTSGTGCCHVLGLLRLELGRPPVNEGGLQLPVGRRLPAVRVDRRGDGTPDPGPPPVHDAPRRGRPTCSTRSTPAAIRRCWTSAPRPTTWSSTAGSSARAASGSIAPTSSSRSSRCSASRPRRPRLKFGFLLDAFRYGAPPHAGFAFGIDRLVALLVGEENIREVIAFPKTQSGGDPLTHAPSELDPEASSSRARPPPAAHARPDRGHRQHLAGPASDRASECSTGSLRAGDAPATTSSPPRRRTR